MSNHEEQISCLMDGDLSGKDMFRMLDWMNASPAAGAMWTRYHLVRHVLREEQTPIAFNAGFAERVSRRIESEPHWLPPIRKRSLRDVPPLRWAVAASLAALAVLAAQELRFLEGEPGERPPSMAVNVQTNSDAQLHAEAEERLRDYLAMHRESVQVVGEDDTLLRARMVSYSP